MNNEPVAWMQTLLDGHTGEVKHTLEFIRVGINDIPLYTHPVKELTNEVYFCSRCGKRLGDGIHTCTPPADILRKAQEQ